jgi:hypothetical protein
MLIVATAIDLDPLPVSRARLAVVECGTLDRRCPLKQVSLEQSWF